MRRNSKWWPMLVLALLLCGLMRYGDENAAAQGENLLRNPGFEGNFFAWGGINEIQVAHEWTPWWAEDTNHDPAWHRPEYKRALAAIFPNRVMNGDSAQQWFTFHASHLAGMYQQVFNVTPGQNYRFSIWAQVWSSVEDDPNVSVLPANPHLRIGIDPTGNWSSGAGTVVWSGEASMSSIIDQWGAVSIEAVAQNDIITVFMRTSPDFANKHNDIYWDNASLVAVGPAAPPPTNTPLPITATPLPPPPTTTPDIPPTATSAPPSSTPTLTVTPQATDMPSPTVTSTPTHTPEPSPTPLSTETPGPPTETSTAATSTPVEAVAAAVTDAAATPVSLLTPTTEAAGSDTGSGSLIWLIAGGLVLLLVAMGLVLVLRFRS